MSISETTILNYYLVELSNMEHILGGMFLDEKTIVKKTKESSEKWYNFELSLWKFTDE